MTMSNEMRLVKFELLIRDIHNAIDGYNFGGDYKRCENESMMLIYDYEKLNEYGKIILENSKVPLFEYSRYLWTGDYSVENLKDSKIKIKATKELIRLCTENCNKNRKNAYNFIFWAMMVLTVDKTDKEEKLSLICDFARMLKISDEEMIDIVQVIKVLYHEEQEEFEFKSQTVPSYFSKVFNLYN